MDGSYHRKTGDGEWLEKSLTILRDSIKQVEAETPAEPQKSMRPGEGADSAELRSANCQR